MSSNFAPADLGSTRRALIGEQGPYARPATADLCSARVIVALKRTGTERERDRRRARLTAKERGREREAVTVIERGGSKQALQRDRERERERETVSDHKAFPQLLHGAAMPTSSSQMPESIVAHQRDKRCNICGAVGYSELIATCSRCGEAHEHVYCMCKNCLEVPEVWLCEECVLLRCAVKENPTKSGGKGTFKNSKVKYISMEELAKISPEVRKEFSFRRKPSSNCGPCKKPQSSSQLNSGSNCGLSPRTSLCKKTSNVPQTLLHPVKEKQNSSCLPSRNMTSSPTHPMKYKQNPFFSRPRSMQSPKDPAKDKENPCVSPSRCMQSPKDANVQIGSMIPKQASSLSKRSEAGFSLPPVLKARASPANTTGCKQEVKVPQKRAELLNSSDADTADAATGAPVSSPAPSKLSFRERMPGGSFHVDARAKNLKAKMKDLAPVYSEHDSHYMYSPVNDATWTGCFEIVDGSAASGLSNALHAHPPAKVSRKAYELSKHMPGILHFDMFPRCNIWPEIFKDYCPGCNDISLYFFPRSDRYKVHYVSLLERLAKDDLVMRSHLFSMELLLFSSKQLHRDCQRIEERHYIWGVFRCISKNRKPFTSCQIANVDGNGNEVVDMDVDMIGGKEVGRVDVPVPRKHCKEVVDIPPPPSFNGLRMDITPPQGFKALRMDITPPPGFEGHYPKKHKSSSLTIKIETGPLA